MYVATSVFIIADLLLNGFGDHKLYHCLIIEHITSAKTIPVGHGIFYFTYCTWNGKLLYLEDIYITANHQSELLHIASYYKINAPFYWHRKQESCS